MSRDALWFERLLVRRMPGIGDGGFRLDDLSPGINIVHGPNASGKTTTARAFEALLWPRAAAPERASVAGRFRLGGASWVVELDAGRARYQRDGAEAAAPPLPPAEARDRYRLSLPELLAADNRELAAEIVRESAGGYDLSRAAAALDVRDGASRRTNEQKALQAARERLREARKRQDELRAEEAELGELRRRAAAAAEAGSRARLLERALEHATAVEEEAAARRALAAFPEAMARLRGDEADRLDTLRRKLEEARLRRADAERALEDADAARRDAGLPEEGVPPQRIAALRRRIEALGELRRAVEAHERMLAEALARRDEEARALGGADGADGAAAAAAVAAGSGDHATAADGPLRISGMRSIAAAGISIDAAAIQDLAEFARDAGELHARRAAADAELRWLAGAAGAAGTAGDGARAGAPRGDAARGGDARGNGAPDDRARAEDIDALADTLADAAALLRRWLRASGGAGGEERRLRRLGSIAAVLLLAASLAGAVIVPAALAPALALALAALVLLLLLLRRAAGPDARSVHRTEFERLAAGPIGIAPPARWTVDDVAACLDRIERRLAEARHAAERARRRTEVERRRAALGPELDALEARRAALAGRLGLAPEGDPARLFWLVQRIGRWRDAAGDVAAAAAARDAARAQYERALAEAGQRLAPFGYVDLDDVADLAAAVEDLERRRDAHRQAMDAAAQARRRLEMAESEAASLEEERVALLAGAGLGPDDESVLRDRCARLDAFREARQRCADAERRREDARRRLEEAPGYSPDLADRGADALRDALEAAEREAAEAEALRDRISAIAARVENAKRGHDVEAALAEVARCEEALREGRDRDALAVVAGVLVRFVQHATRDRHRPEVFHRARQLFTRITHGRYRLDFDDGDPPAFRAFDTETGVGHALDELSSGTRVQLLLAVRIAFVESRETGARLPLLLDETLGNSDDERALAIMETALALAADGRQLFYFTAQPDEVGKWRGVLERRPDVPSRIIDLARARRLARRGTAPLPVVDPPASTIPEPGDLSHDEYGRILGVPPIDVDGDIGGVHLWHLVDDPKALHRLLALRVETWGALRSLVGHGGLDLLGDDADAYARARAAARALETAAAAARIGRGRRVDRYALVASGAVSDRFLDAMLSLCEACGGDAQMLMQALDEGRLARFHARKREALRDYLERHGYLGAHEPLDGAQIRARALAAVAPEIAQGIIAVAQVDRIVRACIGERTGGGRDVGSPAGTFAGSAAGSGAGEPGRAGGLQGGASNGPAQPGRAG
ncbi:MAG TPA: hypothetical protein VF158_07130 [Longimicrobiales bacterium]